MPDSRAQVRLAHAVMGGKAKRGVPPRKVAREMLSKMHGKSMKDLPEKSKLPNLEKGLMGSRKRGHRY